MYAYDVSASSTARNSASTFCVIELQGGQFYSLPRTCQVVRIIAGYAWITFDGQEIVLRSGEQMQLVPGHEPALISTPVNRPLVFEVWNS
jgi:hypothetical protein